MHALQERYHSLTSKTLAFMKAATALYDARYIVKIDDDVYLRTDRLPYALQQYEDAGAGGALHQDIGSIDNIAYAAQSWWGNCCW